MKKRSKVKTKQKKETLEHKKKGKREKSEEACIEQRKKVKRDLLEEESSVSSESSSSDGSGLTLDNVIDESSSSCDDEVGKKRSMKKKKRKKDNAKEVEVEFIFCDMDEKFFGGIKALIVSNTSSFLNATNCLDITNLILENVEVGTVVSTEGYEEDYVYGFASILNLTVHKNHQVITSIKQLCVQNCPDNYLAEVQLLFSGATRRPVGLLLREGMLNLPMIVTHAIHQQLLLDVEWASGKSEKKNDSSNNDDYEFFDFGMLVRIAPSFPSNTSSVGSNPIYKYLDDEVLAANAEFVYSIDPSKTKMAMENPYIYTVIIISFKGYRASVKDLSKMLIT